MIEKIIQFGIRHKIAASALILAILGGGYYGYTKIFSDDGTIRYATAQVQKGTLIVSISGNGQVSVSNQVDIKPKVSGDLIYVGVKNGQEVRSGALIAQLDAGDARKTVRDAEVNLESAKLNLEKLKGQAGSATPRLKQEAEDALAKTYEEGFSSVTKVFLDIPSIMSGLENTLFNNTVQSTQDNITWYVNQIDHRYDERGKVIRYRDDVYDAYNRARTSYNSNFDNYKTTSRSADKQTIEELISQTYDTTKIIADTVKEASNFIDFVKDTLERYDLAVPSIISTHQSSLNSYTDKTSTHLINLLNVKNSIKNAKEGIVDADLDIQSQELTVRQRENALLDAKEKLADYFVSAPFDGVITNADLKKGDSVSSASILAILITRQKLAEISLNEVDAAKVKAGQKATLTFDAVPDLTITGEVAELDTIGTVSQGVVTYNIKIAFDTQDERVRPGMSVSASIITEAKPDVLLAPNSALKSQGGMSYVEIPSETDMSAATANVSGAVFGNPIRQQRVEVGLSNDEFTEIVNGLGQGDLIVTRTIQPTTAQTTQTQQQGGLRIPGLPGGGGGGFRR